MDSLRRNIPRIPTPPPKVPAPPSAAIPSLPIDPPQETTKKTPSLSQGKFLVSFFRIFTAGLFLILCLAGFFLYRGFSLTQSMQFENRSHPSFFSSLKSVAATLLTEERPSLRGEESGRINILLLGRAGENYPGKNLTDTLMLMSVDTNKKKVGLLSLPRDLYVPIHDTHLYTKINSLYQYGLQQNEGITPLKETISDITGQPIHYFFVVDFDSFEKIVDTLGGIQVDVVRDFYDTRYPGKNYSYETFEIKKGWQTLDGSTALKYVRERHADPEGDFGRAKRQQQVIQAVKDKVFSLGTLFNIITVNNLLETLGENIKTNMSLEEMSSLLELSRVLDTQNVTSVVVDAWKKESLLRVSHVVAGGVNAFILVPRVGNFSEIQDLNENLFHLDALKERSARIAEEAPTLTVFYAREDSFLVPKMEELMNEIGFGQSSFLQLRSLEESPQESMIIDRTGLSKPYSLDELLRKLSLQKVDNPPYSLPEKLTSDFVLIMGNDILTPLSLDNGTFGEDTREPVYSEALPPQSKPEKKK